jgi:hypothetical protein
MYSGGNTSGIPPTSVLRVTQRAQGLYSKKGFYISHPLEGGRRRRKTEERVKAMERKKGKIKKVG